MLTYLMLEMTFTASLCVKMFFSVFFLPGALADCEAALYMTAPTEMEALSGSCLHIPCNFSVVDKEGQVFDITKPIAALWIKEDHDFGKLGTNVIFNSDGTNNKYPMKVTGDLTQKNCTTLFSSLIIDYTNRYFLRIENWPFRATAICNHTQINVKDSAPSPWIQTSHQQLKEKESVTITCSALTPCPLSHFRPKLTWNLQQDAANNMEENTNRTFTTKIQQVITLSDQHDGYNIICSAAYPVDEGTQIKTAETNLTLSVSYAPKDTSASISPSGLVYAGTWVNLTCSSRAKPPVSNFTWFKTSTDGPTRVSEGDVYSFNLTDDTEGDYYCEAANDVGKQTSAMIHVKTKETISFQRAAVVGGVIGILIIICLAVCLWCLILKRRTQKETENQKLEELPDVSANKTEEEIQYGEIDFSKGWSGGSYLTGLDSEHEEETVYAQVKVSGAAQSLTYTGDGSEDLYAQVKKK